MNENKYNPLTDKLTEPNKQLYVTVDGVRMTWSEYRHKQTKEEGRILPPEYPNIFPDPKLYADVISADKKFIESLGNLKNDLKA